MAEGEPAPARAIAPWLRWSIDAGPALAFLIVLLATRDFRLATWFVVGGATLALGLDLAVERKIAPMPAVTGVTALLFGGLSLALKRADILQMKMTIVDALLGALLLGGLAMRRNPLKALLGGAFHLADRAWAALTIRYALFWWACAIANEIVRRTQSKAVWAEFRVGVIVAAVVFALAQTPFLTKHGVEPAKAEPPEPPAP